VHPHGFRKTQFTRAAPKTIVEVYTFLYKDPLSDLSHSRAPSLWTSLPLVWDAPPPPQKPPPLGPVLAFLNTFAHQRLYRGEILLMTCSPATLDSRPLIYLNRHSIDPSPMPVHRPSFFPPWMQNHPSKGNCAPRCLIGLDAGAPVCAVARFGFFSPRVALRRSNNTPFFGLVPSRRTPLSSICSGAVSQLDLKFTPVRGRAFVPPSSTSPIP